MFGVIASLAVCMHSRLLMYLIPMPDTLVAPEVPDLMLDTLAAPEVTDLMLDTLVAPK